MFVFMPLCVKMPLCICVWRQQELSNLLHEKKYLKALGLAISLDQPHTALTVIKGRVSCSLHCIFFSSWPSASLPSLVLHERSLKHWGVNDTTLHSFFPSLNSKVTHNKFSLWNNKCCCTSYSDWSFWHRVAGKPEWRLVKTDRNASLNVRQGCKIINSYLVKLSKGFCCFCF